MRDPDWSPLQPGSSCELYSSYRLELRAYNGCTLALGVGSVCQDARWPGAGESRTVYPVRIDRLCSLRQGTDGQGFANPGNRDVEVFLEENA